MFLLGHTKVGKIMPHKALVYNKGMKNKIEQNRFVVVSVIYALKISISSSSIKKPQFDIKGVWFCCQVLASKF